MFCLLRSWQGLGTDPEPVLRIDRGRKHGRFYRRDEPGEYGVDDENAYFMRGVSGNAGAFWSISDLEKLADAIYEKRLYPAGLAEMAERSYTDGFPQKRRLGYLIIDEDTP